MDMILRILSHKTFEIFCPEIFYCDSTAGILGRCGIAAKRAVHCESGFLSLIWCLIALWSGASYLGFCFLWFTYVQNGAKNDNKVFVCIKWW